MLFNLYICRRKTIFTFLKTITMENQMQQLDSIANINGGGLSTEITGKYTSVRHAKAKLSKHTAGEAAKIISKEIGEKMTAKELVSSWSIIFNREPEWHHAGFYKGNRGKTMGRTFFFTNADIVDFIEKLPELKTKKEAIAAEEKRKSETTVCGFTYIWEQLRGDRKKHKQLRFLKGSGHLKGSLNFTELTEAEYNDFNYLEGKKYYGWDEPTHGEITGSPTEKQFLEIQQEQQKEAKRQARNLKARASYAEKNRKKMVEMQKEEARAKIEEYRKTAEKNGFTDISNFEPEAVAASLIIDDQYKNEGKQIKTDMLTGEAKSMAQAQAFSRLLERNGLYIEKGNRNFWKVFSLCKY